jgi:hypothetical protein
MTAENIPDNVLVDLQEFQTASRTHRGDRSMKITNVRMTGRSGGDGNDGTRRVAGDPAPVSREKRNTGRWSLDTPLHAVSRVGASQSSMTLTLRGARTTPPATLFVGRQP